MIYRFVHCGEDIPPLFLVPKYYRGKGLEESFLLQVSFNLGGVNNYFCTASEKDVSYEGIFAFITHIVLISPHSCLSLSLLSICIFLLGSHPFILSCSLRLLKSQATHVLFFNHFNN